MSIRTFLFFLFIILIFGCKPDSQVENKYADLSETEKDSLATFYHELSMAMYQPSEMHRRFKDTALMVKPDHVEYRQRLSYSYKKRGEHIQAMKILNEAVERDIEQNRTFALQYRAWSLLYFYRDYENTIKDVDLIIKMEPKNKYTTCHGEPCEALKGQALYKLGNYRDAIKVFENVLEVEQEMGWDPIENLHANFYRARSHSELGEYAKAKEIYQLLLAYNPRLTEAHFQLGNIYFLQGETENALLNLETAAELLTRGIKMGEPYYEAFDEVFQYQIDEMLQKLSELKRKEYID